MKICPVCAGRGELNDDGSRRDPEPESAGEAAAGPFSATAIRKARQDDAYSQLRALASADADATRDYSAFRIEKAMSRVVRTEAGRRLLDQYRANARIG